MLDRCAIVLFPQEPFGDWVNNLPTEGTDPFDPEDYEPTLYLIEDFNEQEEFLAWLENHYAQLFAKELSVWCDDRSLWPELTPDNFAHWFELSLLNSIEDLCENPLPDLSDQGAN